MNKKAKFNVSFVLSIIIIFISAFLFWEENTLWHYPAVLGVWLFFDFLSFKINKKSTLDLIFENKLKKFGKLFFILFIFGAMIELIGRVWLNLWHYTDSLDESIIGYLFYPFILMSFKELYESLKKFSKNKVTLTTLSVVLGVIIWEIPNVFSKDWVYTIPLITFEIFGINIIVILGWIILIQGTLKIYRISKIKR